MRADESFMKNQWWKSEYKITSGVHKCSIFDEIKLTSPTTKIYTSSDNDYQIIIEKVATHFSWTVFGHSTPVTGVEYCGHLYTKLFKDKYKIDLFSQFF